MKWCVVYATDKAGLDLYELSHAVLRTRLPDADVVLLTDFDVDSGGAKAVNVGPLLDSAGITSAFSGGWTRFVPMSSAKLVIPAVPELEGYDRVLYLDTDTLVLDGSEVRKMVEETYLSESDCAGAADDSPPFFLSRNNARLAKLMNAIIGSGCLDGKDDTLVRNMMKGVLHKYRSGALQHAKDAPGICKPRCQHKVGSRGTQVQVSRPGSCEYAVFDEAA